MNAERLRELAEFLLQLESITQIQPSIEQLRDALQQLASSPGDPNYQNHVASIRTQLTGAMTRLADETTPARLAAIDSIGGGPYFSGALAARVDATIAANAMTPSVAFTDLVD